MNKTTTSIMLVLFVSAASTFASCASPADIKVRNDNERFLEAPFGPGDKETFRVLIMSNTYEVTQTDHKDTIELVKDPGGDKYICDEIKKYDKIDEAREGMYHVSLFPDRGTLMKVRPYKPLNLIELDNLILDDLQRWSFKFPRRVIQPATMYVKYRIVLRKRQSDAQIFKEVEKKMMGEEEEKKE